MTRGDGDLPTCTLIVNPRATAFSPREVREVIAVLGQELQVRSAVTTRRGDAARLAVEARRANVAVVVSFGGDGTLNEVVNGLLSPPVGPAVPLLGVVPAGSTNVFARAIGMDRKVVNASLQLVEAARQRRVRRVNLGQVNGRWFTSAAGQGLDAAVVTAVERQRERGRKARPLYYLGAALHEFARGADRRLTPLTLQSEDDLEVSDLFMVIVQNIDPWTYLGRRPIAPCPPTSTAHGLGVFGMRDLSTPAMLRHVAQVMSGRTPEGAAVVSAANQRAFSVRAASPVCMAVDGDATGEGTLFTFRSVPAALDVLR